MTTTPVAPTRTPVTHSEPAPDDTALDDVPTGPRILVGVDGSASSLQALRWAQFLSRATGSPIEAVTAWAPMNDYSAATGGWTAYSSDWNPSGQAEKTLVQAVDEAFGEHRPAALRITIQEGGAAKVLIDLSQDAQLLVVGSRGHGGFAGLLLGSVSASVAEHAGCPVLVVHGDSEPPE